MKSEEKEIWRMPYLFYCQKTYNFTKKRDVILVILRIDIFAPKGV